MENKKIYAFDFDGTIVTSKFPKIGEPIMEVIDLIHEVKKQGHYIILNTMREDERLEEAIEFCRKWRISFDAVNDNLPHMKTLYKNNPRKIFANYYIDDHNMGVSAVNKDYGMLEQQFKAQYKEYFNNSLLKFEELKAGMWVWDNEGKRYLKLSGTEKINGERRVCTDYNGFRSVLQYRYNRFYKNEVVDNDR